MPSRWNPSRFISGLTLEECCIAMGAGISIGGRLGQRFAPSKATRSATRLGRDRPKTPVDLLGEQRQIKLLADHRENADAEQTRTSSTAEVEELTPGIVFIAPLPC